MGFKGAEMTFTQRFTLVLLLAAPTIVLAEEESYSLGLQAFKASRYAEAVAHFSEATVENPDWSTGYLMLGWSELRSGGEERAIGHLERALKLEPSNTTAQLRLGEAYAQVGRYSDTLGFLSKVDDSELADPQRNQLAQTRGLAYLKTGQPTLAVEQYEIATGYDPTNAPLHHALGAAARKAGDLATAAEALGRTVELDPEDHDARLAFVGVLVTRAGQSEAADKADLYQVATQQAEALVAKDRSAESLILLGEAHLGTKSYEPSIDAFQAALVTDPDRWIAHYYLGSAYVAVKRFAAAEASLRAALLQTTAPVETSQTWRLLGHAFEKQQKFEEAQMAYKRGGDSEGAARVVANAKTAEENARIDRENQQAATLQATAEALEAELRSLERGEVPN